jgi:hypothetical protein
MGNLLTFEEFINENRVPDVHAMSANNVYASNRIPAFNVKLSGMNQAKIDMEQQQSGSFKKETVIKKGDLIEVYDIKNKKSIRGIFVSGKKETNGEYTEVTLRMEDEKIKKIKVDGVEKVK